MKDTELQLLSKFKNSTPPLNIPCVGNGRGFRDWKRLSLPVTLNGGLSRFQPRTLLPFPTLGILRNGIDSCNLECSRNSGIFITLSDYHHERESHFLAIVNKSCALISNPQYNSYCMIFELISYICTVSTIV